jgi:hypothetical protein
MLSVFDEAVENKRARLVSICTDGIAQLQARTIEPLEKRDLRSSAMLRAIPAEIRWIDDSKIWAAQSR